MTIWYALGPPSTPLRGLRKTPKNGKKLNIIQIFCDWEWQVPPNKIIRMVYLYVLEAHGNVFCHFQTPFF